MHSNTLERTLINMAAPTDHNIITAEIEKVERYQELAFKSKRIHTDRNLNHNRSNITLVMKNTQLWTLMDISVPADKIIINS